MEQWKHRMKETMDTLVFQTPRETWPIASGMAAFWATLAMATFQLKVLRVSTGTRPPMIPSTLGVLSVCAASLASHQAAMIAHSTLLDYQKRSHKPPPESITTTLTKMKQQLPDNLKNYARPSIERSRYGRSSSPRVALSEHVNLAGLIQLPTHTLRICVVGLLAFKLGGGRFWAIAPSSYTNLGSFARVRGASLPATEQYASAAQRAALERMGRLWGCHTCGSRRLFATKMKLPGMKSGASLFVGDHMPPKAVAKQINARWYNRLPILRHTNKVRFRFYPQCTPCSNRQGSILSTAVQKQSQNSRTNLQKAGGGSLAHFHGFRPRLFHAVAGGTVASVTVIGASDLDIQRGNSQRLYVWQREIEDWIAEQRRRLPFL